MNYIVPLLYVIIFIVIFVILGTGAENYWVNYNNMPGIPKTYITPHFILNQSCYQNAEQ